MDEPLTEELLNELLASSDPNDFVGQLPANKRELAPYLNEMLVVHGKERNEVIHASNLDHTYAYQILAGTRANPSRNKILQLAFAIGLTPRETDRALQAGGKSRLYCKDRRDAIIIYAVENGLTLAECDDELYRLGEATLVSREG